MLKSSYQMEDSLTRRRNTLYFYFWLGKKITWHRDSSKLTHASGLKKMQSSRPEQWAVIEYLWKISHWQLHLQKGKRLKGIRCPAEYSSIWPCRAVCIRRSISLPQFPKWLKIVSYINLFSVLVFIAYWYMQMLFEFVWQSVRCHKAKGRKHVEYSPSHYPAVQPSHHWCGLTTRPGFYKNARTARNTFFRSCAKSSLVSGWHPSLQRSPAPHKMTSL